MISSHQIVNNNDWIFIDFRPRLKKYATHALMRKVVPARHHIGAVKGDQSSFCEYRIKQTRNVAVTQENFGVFPDHVKIQIRENSAGPPTTAKREYRVNARVSESRVDIGRSVLIRSGEIPKPIHNVITNLGLKPYGLQSLKRQLQLK
jgi:hypothetical protein